MLLRRLVTVLSMCCLSFGSLGLVACGEEEEEEHEEEDHDPTSPSCAEIMDLCHAADEGSGPAHECHDVAHADVEADCAAQKDACLATCAPM